VTCVIDISLLQFGQISIVGTTERAKLMLVSFLSPDKMSGRAKGSPWIGCACQSEKQELESARPLRDSGSIANIVVRLLAQASSKKRCSLFFGKWRCSRSATLTKRRDVKLQIFGLGAGLWCSVHEVYVPRPLHPSAHMDMIVTRDAPIVIETGK
jgi:hypothetical protein